MAAVKRSQYFDAAHKQFWSSVVMPWILDHHRDQLKSSPVFSPVRSPHIKFTMEKKRVRLEDGSAVEIIPVDYTWPAIISESLGFDSNPHRIFTHRGDEDVAKSILRRCAQDYVDACRILAGLVSGAMTSGENPATPIDVSGPGGEDAADHLKCTLSEDGRVVVWRGNRHTLSPKPAGVIQCLWEAWQDGTIDVSWERCTERAGITEQGRMRDTFRKIEGWQDLIEEGEKRGMCRLKDADKTPRSWASA